MKQANEKLIVEVLKEGRKRWMDLERKLVKSGKMSAPTLSRTLKDLEINGFIKREVDSSKRPAIAWYMLAEFAEEVKVAETVKRLWQILFRPPTPKEIAVETGITPEVAEKLAYKTAKKTGWFHPSHELINERTGKLGEVLVCAARMRDGKPDDWHELYKDEDGPQIKKEAERFLKKFPNILPQLTEDGEKVWWPPEAIKRLGKEYEPKDRSSPKLWVVPR